MVILFFIFFIFILNYNFFGFKVISHTRVRALSQKEFFWGVSGTIYHSSTQFRYCRVPGCLLFLQKRITIPDRNMLPLNINMLTLMLLWQIVVTKISLFASHGCEMTGNIKLHVVFLFNTVTSHSRHSMNEAGRLWFPDP